MQRFVMFRSAARCSSRSPLALGIAVLVAALALAGGSDAAGAAWTVTPVASGLDSPRGVLLTDNGTLLVAEAGHGGDSCRPSPAGPFCIGLTSQISKVNPTTGARQPLVRGLYSRAVQTEGVTGVDGLSARNGQVLATLTSYPQELAGWSCAAQPTDCANALAGARAQAGQLIAVTPAGAWKPLAGVGGSDYQWALAGNQAYSREPANANPYGVFAVPGGAFVADAGANTLDYVSAAGKVIVESAFAPPAAGFPADTVPTCVTVLRGNLYAASLSGHLWKRNGRFTPTEVSVADASGKSLIHHVTGCVSDNKSGAIYLVDMWGTPGPPVPAGPQSAAGTGSVVELAGNGVATVLANGLNFPNGVALATDGSLYVTVNSTCTATGTPLPFCINGGAIVHLHR